MKSSGKYIDLWTNHKEAIIEKLHLADKKQSIQLNKTDFERVGNREKSKYSFNLEFIDGIVSNNIDGTAVARDLARVLLNQLEVEKTLRSGHFKISMDKQFCLWIVKLL